MQDIWVYVHMYVCIYVYTYVHSTNSTFVFVCPSRNRLPVIKYWTCVGQRETGTQNQHTITGMTSLPTENPHT